MQIANKEQITWLEKPLIPNVPAIKWETVLIVTIMILALFSRFYILGERVMSHDETNHVVPSFELSQGQGYRHDPITHGPFQFHVVALTYFLFGDTDFTSRVPSALINVATIFFAWWGFRRYLGRSGALIAAFLFLISPYSLFYGRYTRNESFVGLWALLLFFGMLRYLDTGKTKYLYIFSLAVVMNFVTKETSFIYAAQGLIFLAVLFFTRVVRRPWINPGYFRPFILALMVALVLIGAGLGTQALIKGSTAGAETAAASPTAGPTPAETAAAAPVSRLPVAVFALGLIAAVGAMALLVKGYSLDGLRSERSFDLLILLGTLVLPQLSAFPVKMLGFDPLIYQWPDFLPTAIALVVLGLISIVIGLWWKPRVWLGCAALFYAIFTVLYTTLFTNGVGFLTGIVGSLGYWLNQHGFNRGQQPIYYFALLQIPMYEYLPAVGTILALFLGWKLKAFSALFPAETPETLEQPVVGPAEALPAGEEAVDPQPDEVLPAETEAVQPAAQPDRIPVLALFLYWSFTSLVAYSIAGEKMPWLTYHIVIPMILCSGWAFGYLVDTTPWQTIRQKRGWLAALVLPVFLLSVAGVLGSLLGSQPPFQGKDLVQLESTATFLFSAITVAVSGWGLFQLVKDWTNSQVTRAFTAAVLVVLAVLTARAAIRSSYINYDNPTEFLVYAHAARGPKEILAQVEEISQRTTGGLDIAVAYDEDALYPFWWYFRHYPNKVWYGANPTRELRNDPIVIVSEAQYSKVEPLLQDDFYQYDYFRLWWPMQAYWNLKWEDISNEWAQQQTQASGAEVSPKDMNVLEYFKTAWPHVRPFFTDPQVREAIWRIWLNADYSKWAELKGSQDLTLTTWQPSNRIRMYIRKDIVSKLWNYGAPPVEVKGDPYQKGMVSLGADQLLGAAGNAAGQFQSPRGIAVAPDGTLYVADSKNNRIQHLTADGTVLHTWGSYASISDGEAPGGTFNEPWGIAVGPDGSVYVADTWNNRIQKFTTDGQFVTMWGKPGQAETPDAFWGPRGVATDSEGRVYVTDTGNKRVAVFDANGQFVSQFGTQGYEAGQFDEPVGIAVDQAGSVYVADTWNQRIQVFTPDQTRTSFIPTTQWDIDAWFGQSLDNKPFLTVDGSGNVFVADPEGPRVLQFTADGQFVRGWGAFGTGGDGFALVSGVAVDQRGGIWVVDAGNNRVMHFTLPQ